jgi:hypothetical protein
MPMVNELATYLAAQGEGTEGVDLFANVLPSTPRTAAGVFQFSGRPSIWTMGTTVSESPMLQVQCRASTRAGAEQKAYSIWKKLERLSNVTISGVRYYSIACTKVPSVLKIDSDNYVTSYCEFEVRKAVSP